MTKKKKILIKKEGKIVPKVVEEVDPRILCSNCGCQPEPILRVSMGSGVMFCRKCYKDK